MPKNAHFWKKAVKLLQCSSNFNFIYFSLL